VFQKSEKGQGLVEYALIFILVVIIVIVMLWLFGPAVGRMFSDIVHAV
jgi:pilus assembly protein Flp/PilA